MMMQRNRKWVLLALLVTLGVVCLTSATEARRRFRRWWFQPPAPAIANSSYEGEANGRLRTIGVLDGAITTNLRTNLESADVTAEVLGGALTIAPISFVVSDSDETTLTSTTTCVDVVVTDTELIRTYFSSIFYATGDATVVVKVEETDDSGEEPVVTTTESDPIVIPVRLFGSIHGHDDGAIYHLRGGIRGYLRVEDEETGEITYSFIGVRIGAEGVPTVEEEEPEIPLPS